MSNRRIPRVALVLGLAGLVPFAASALLSLYSDPETSSIALRSLAAYAAVILSFLGGVRWGVLLSDRHRFDSYGPAIVSVVPSILAWLALLLPGLPMLALLLAGLLLQYVVDSPYSPLKAEPRIPEWYPHLRLLLSTGAIICVGIGLYASL